MQEIISSSVSNLHNKKKLKNSKFLLLTLLTIQLSCVSEKMNNLEYIHANSNIWHVEVITDNFLVTADYGGNVSLFELNTETPKWQYPAGAFIFDLKTADIDQNKDIETAFVTAEGELVVLNSNGKKLWSFFSKLPLYNVGIGNFLGDDKLEVVCGGIDRHVYVFDFEGNLIGKPEKVERLVHRIGVGNLYGNDYDEILVIENRTIANLMTFENNQLKSVWRESLKVPSDMVNWENPRGSFFAFSLKISDLDEDGTCEIIMGDTYFNKQAVMVTNNKLEPLWISKGLPPFRYQDKGQFEFYSTAFVRSSDVFTEYPGKEVVSVAGGTFRIWDSKGSLLGSFNSNVGFTDFQIQNNKMYLGSCPNGDDYIYKINIDKNWEQTISNIEFQGIIKNIKQSTAELKSQVVNYEPEYIPENIYDLAIGFGSISTDDEGLETIKKQDEWFNKKFPYNNLRLVRGLKAIEPTPPLDNDEKPWNENRWKVDAINGTMTVEEILKKARFIEENKIPTYFYIGHSCMPFITLETAEKILETAPNYCLGFQTSEDEDIDLVPNYFENYFQKLIDICGAYDNKKCITKNKGIWWMSTPANQSVYNALFRKGRKKVAMAATEDSNSRTPEMNLMGRGGLWQAGLLLNNDVSIHGDLFSFNRFQQWEYPKAGHPYLRLLVAHTTMGMTRISTRIREIMPTEDDPIFKTLGEESTEVFYHMLGKGLVFSPKREDILGYSPIGMVVHKPSEKWLKDAHNGHSPEKWIDDPELHNAVFPHNGNLWGMTNTPAHAFQKVIFNKNRQFGDQVPATPYGLVAFVPEFTDLHDVANVEEWWHTDGTYIWKNEEEKYTGEQASKLLKEDFAKASERLPFRQLNEAVFMQIIKITPNKYRLYLIDTGWVNPQSRNVLIKIQMEGDYEVQNILSKEKLELKNHKFEVAVPSGLFTILDVSSTSNQ